jgi:hypothetical protein
METEVRLFMLTCRRCGYEWAPRYPRLPAVCARCKRFDWNEEKPVRGGRNPEKLPPSYHKKRS